MIDLTRPLAARLVPNATVYPTMRLSERPNELLMGVFDADGEYLANSALDRRSGEVGAEVPQELYEDTDPAVFDEGIYCGVLYFHFGHFLLESIARLWYAQQHPDVPLLWAGARNWYKGPGAGAPPGDSRLPQAWVQHSELVPWQREMLEILGVRNPVAIVTRPTRVENLHMPEIGYRYDDQFHPDHAAFLAGYSGPEQDPEARLWLSRSGIGTTVRDLNAAAIERRLERSGWDIRSPEHQSLREQLDQMARASVIAGEEGSAFHLLMLLDDVSRKRFEIVRRLGVEHRNMHTIGDAREVDQRFTTLSRERVLQARGRFVTKVSESAAETLDLLEVPIDTPEVDPSPSSLRVGEVLRALRESAPSIESLLALAVTEARPLMEVGASEVTVVSENLGTDPRLPELSAASIYELAPSLYFSAFEDPRHYDAIILDGTDADAVLRNAHAAVGATGAHSIWLLSAPEPGLEGLWRTAARLLDTFPGLDARTIVTAEDEPAVVLFWFAPRGEPVPLLTDSEQAGPPPAGIKAALRPGADLTEAVAAVTKARREAEALVRTLRESESSQAFDPESEQRETHEAETPEVLDPETPSAEHHPDEEKADQGSAATPMRRRSLLHRIRDRIGGAGSRSRE